MKRMCLMYMGKANVERLTWALDMHQGIVPMTEFRDPTKQKDDDAVWAGGGPVREDQGHFKGNEWVTSVVVSTGASGRALRLDQIEAVDRVCRQHVGDDGKKLRV